MNWTAKIFNYCERGQDPAFWAEPLNAVTNAAFLVAALAAFIIWLRQPGENRRFLDLFLIFVVAVIGTGSFLFHTTATVWASFADVVPIGIFMMFYFGYALKRFVGLGWVFTFVGLGLFFVALWQASVVRCNGGACLNGSVAYFPAFAVLLLIGGWLLFRRHSAGLSLIAAGLVFAASLTFRSIDMAICPMTSIAALSKDPIGTHFLWHVLNATLLFLLLRAAVLYGGRPRDFA